MTEEKDGQGKDGQGKEEEPVQEPIKVNVINQPKEKEPKNPTSEDTIDIYAFGSGYTPSDEEIKEMTDAQ